MTDNEENQTPLSNDELEEIVEEETNNSVEKRPRKGYVMTEKRREALERGRKARAEKVKIKQSEKAEEKELKKKTNQRRKAMETLGISEDEYSNAFAKSTSKTTRPQAELSDSDSEEEIIVKKKKPKSKKKKIVYVDESESEEEPEPKSVERVRRKTYSEREMKQLMQESEPKPFRLKRV